MDRKCGSLFSREGYSYKQAKQRASIKWLLSKSYNHKTPEELKEPFYKDHDEVEHLKPPIIRALANAELYCMALSHLYQDPNYHNLNHWGIIQALGRKGVGVTEPSDCALTETVLIQIPLKMSAHMAVIEAIMSLFLKETVTTDRIVSTIKRFGLKDLDETTFGWTDQEEALLQWVTFSGEALKQKIGSDPSFKSAKEIKFPRVGDVSDLSDGLGVAALVSLYCPDQLDWSEIAGTSTSGSSSEAGSSSSMADSLFNIQLVQKFCRNVLPFNVCHLTVEDMVYLHESIRLNMVLFLADLYYGLEFRPVGLFVQRPGAKKDKIITFSDPDMRIKSPSGFRRSVSSDKNDKEAEPQADSSKSFVVQKGRGVPTLTSVVAEESEKFKKEQQNQDTKSEERGETENNGGVEESLSLLERLKKIPVAGKPSDAPVRHSVYGNGSSSRPSTSGGEGGRVTPHPPLVPGSSRRSVSRRNSIDENASTLSVENLCGSQDNLSLFGRNPDKEMRTHTGRKVSSDGAATAISAESNQYIDNRDLEEMENRKSAVDGGQQGKVSFADLRKQKARDYFHTSGININYMEQEKEDVPKRSSFGNKRNSDMNSNKGATNNVPTQPQQQPTSSSDASPPADAMAAQLNGVRLKLEQRRKRIEEEKRKMELVMEKQREKDLGEDLSAVQTRWLSNSRVNQPEPRTPDIEAMDMDTYTKSLHAMNDSLHDLQSDIQRLAQQHSQIQQMMNTSSTPQPSHNPLDPQPFYISSDSPQHQQPHTPQRRTWGQPQPISFAHQGGGMMNVDWQQPRRQQWGQPQQRPYPGPPPQSYGPGYDPYSSPMRDQWNMYNGNFDSQHNYGQAMGQGGGPAGPYPSQQYGSPSYNPSFSPVAGGNYNQATPARSANSFRLHEASSPRGAGVMGGGPMVGQSTVAQSTPARRRLSENEQTPMSPRESAGPPSFSRQASKEKSPERSSSPNLPPRRLHTGLPAPEETDMEPQNVSFIDSSTEDPDKSNFNDRLSRLNISSGTKTYRVLADGKDSSPSPTRTRPTISSAFKQSRKGSGSESGPSSLRSNSGRQDLTEEEVEALATMKTEALKEDKDASKAFVISFDDDMPKKPKPDLKARRISQAKKNSVVSEISSSDGSNSSRKENVPPELMICIDMNDSSGGSQGESYGGRGGPSIRNGGSPAREGWRSSASPDPVVVGSGPVIPKFDIDPTIPLEDMIPLNPASGDSESDAATGMLIGHLADPLTQDEMQRKKERIMLQSLRRKQQAEEKRLREEEEIRKRREDEAKKEEEKMRKKEEEKARKEAILEQFKLKKEMEKAEEEGRFMPEPVKSKPVPRMRSKTQPKSTMTRQRPKTIHVDNDQDIADSLSASRGPRGSSSNISGLHRSESRNSLASNNERPHTASGGGGVSIASMGMNRNRSLNNRPSSRGPSRRGSVTYISQDDPPSEGNRLASSRYRGSRESLQSGMTYSARRGSNASMYNDNDYYYGGSMRDINNGHVRPRKASSVSHLGPGSLPGYRRRGPGGEYDDGASDISSTSGFSAFGYRSGTRLYREPASKSNRTIILNAIEYVVFPGVVNQETRNRVLDVIDRCDCPHFLLLFRDAKCQFRGLYAYYPDTEEVYKIYGTGPKQVNHSMYDHFFKYNSGGKKFTKIHTKSLTVTIDAFTIHNALWLGKKPKLPDKRDMALVV